MQTISEISDGVDPSFDQVQRDSVCCNDPLPTSSAPSEEILGIDPKTEASETGFAFGILLICFGVLSFGPGLLLGQSGEDIFGFLGAICFISLFAAAACSYAAIGYCRETLQLFRLVKMGNLISIGTALLFCLLICSSVLSFLDEKSPCWIVVGLMPLVSFLGLALSTLFGFISVYFLERKRTFLLFIIAQFTLFLSVVFSFLIMVDISSAY